MRKKYLSALLFGALLFASAGTFTSCKDYDDDIKNLQEQIDKKASLEDLQNQINAMEADVDAAMAAAEEAKAKAQEALDKANAAGGGDVTEDQLTALKKDLQDQIDKLASLEDVKAEITALKQELANTYATQDALDALTLKVNTLSEKVTAIVGTMLTGLVYQPSLYVDGIETTEYAWMNYETLTGTTAAKVEFPDNEETNCKVLTDSKEWNYKETGTWKEFDPVVDVKYHVNPSGAKLTKEDLSIISDDAEKAFTRTSVATPYIDGETDITLENGVLTIPLRAKGSKIPTQPTADAKSDPAYEAAIFALQANVKTEEGEERVVTSDYAALCSSIIEPQSIAYSVKDYNGFDVAGVDCEFGNPDELFTSVETALGKAPSLRVAYNGEIDLSQVLAIHYNQESLTSSAGVHKVWKYGEEKAYGLHYDFELIHYTAGKNVTSDSKYVDDEKIKNGIVAPRIVDPSTGEPTDKTGVSSVGRHPLIRVRVLDANNSVVLYAFVKVEIVQTLGQYVISFDKGSQNFGCDGCAPQLTWSEISTKVLEEVKVGDDGKGLSKEEFVALYKADVAGEATELYNADEMYQYKKVGDKYVQVTEAKDKYGTAIEIFEAQGTTNPVVKWTLSQRDQERIYQLNNEHSYEVYVRYIRRTQNPEETASIAPVYYKIKVTIAKPQGTVVKKIDEYWFDSTEGQNTNTRLNVPYPKDDEDAKPFVVDLDQVWDGNKPTFGVTGFESYTADILANRAGEAGGYKYYFTAGNNDVEVVDQFGNKYKLFAGNSTNAVAVAGAEHILGGNHDVTPENVLQYALRSNTGEYNNDALYATVISKSALEPSTEVVVGTTVMIAKIDNDNTTDKCQITYLDKTNDGGDNVIAKRILNANKSQAAQIGICAYSPCNIALSLIGGTYPADLLRPITVEGNNEGVFTDAESNGSTVNIAEVFDFTDWRGVEFKSDNNYKNVWLYAFYGLQKVEVKTDLITTNLNGNVLGEKLLSEVTNKIVITQDGETDVNLSALNKESLGTASTWDTIVSAMGKIKYENNGNNVGAFQLRIPVDFTYDWGTIRAYVVCNVNSTMGN